MNSDVYTSSIIKKAMNATKNIPNPQKTFKAFQQKCAKVRNEYFKRCDAGEAEKKRLAEIYSEKLLKEKSQEIDTEIFCYLSREKAELKLDLAEIVDGKLNRFRQVALTAPSEEQIRMLQALQIRADTLTKVEVTNIAAMMADNHQALRSLAHLAKQSGFNLVIPDTADSFAEDLREAHEYTLSVLEHLETPDSKLPFAAFDFFHRSADSDKGMYGTICKLLDEKPYTVEQVKEPKTTIEVLEYEENKALAAGDEEKASEIRNIIESEETRKIPSRETLRNEAYNLAIETAKIAEDLFNDDSTNHDSVKEDNNDE